jgi:hypothetical protein
VTSPAFSRSNRRKQSPPHRRHLGRLQCIEDARFMRRRDRLGPALGKRPKYST